MNKNKNIQAEVEKTLLSLDSFSKMKAKPFLFTRIQAKIENKESKWAFNWLFDAPILKTAALLMIISINILSITYINDYYNIRINEENTLTSFADEYSISISTENNINLYNE